MPSLLAALALASALILPQAQTRPPAQQPPTATTEPPTEDPAVTALALKIYSQMRVGKVDASLLTAQMNQALSPTILAQNKPMFDQLGDPTKLTLESRMPIAEGTRYEYLAVFAAAQLHIQIFVTADGKVGGYFLRP